MLFSKELIHVFYSKKGPYEPANMVSFNLNVNDLLGGSIRPVLKDVKSGQFQIDGSFKAEVDRMFSRENMFNQQEGANVRGGVGCRKVHTFITGRKIGQSERIYIVQQADVFFEGIVTTAQGYKKAPVQALAAMDTLKGWQETLNELLNKTDLGSKVQDEALINVGDMAVQAFGKLPEPSAEVEEACAGYTKLYGELKSSTRDLSETVVAFAEKAGVAYVLSAETKELAKAEKDAEPQTVAAAQSLQTQEAKSNVVARSNMSGEAVDEQKEKVPGQEEYSDAELNEILDKWLGGQPIDELKQNNTVIRKADVKVEDLTVPTGKLIGLMQDKIIFSEGVLAGEAQISSVNNADVEKVLGIKTDPKKLFQPGGMIMAASRGDYGINRMHVQRLSNVIIQEFSTIETADKSYAEIVEQIKQKLISVLLKSENVPPVYHELLSRPPHVELIKNMINSLDINGKTTITDIQKQVLAYINQQPQGSQQEVALKNFSELFFLGIVAAYNALQAVPKKTKAKEQEAGPGSVEGKVTGEDGKEIKTDMSGDQQDGGM